MSVIFQLIERLAACYLILRSLLEMVPNAEYRKYVKLFGGLLILATLLREGSVLLQDGKSFLTTELIESDAKKFNEGNEFVMLTSKSADNGLLSTYEDKVKTELNKEICKHNYTVKSLKIRICDDVNSVDYGIISDVNVIVCGIVDKTANISVNTIIVRKKGVEIKNEVKNIILERLNLPDGVVHIECEE